MNTELMPPNETPLAPAQRMGAADIDMLATEIEHRALAVKRLVLACAKFTREHDWIKFGESMYLEGEGAARMVGPLNLHVSEPLFDDEKEGDDYFVSCLLEVSWPKFGLQPMQGMGDCSTLDSFFVVFNDDGTVRPGCQLGKCLAQCGGDMRIAKRMLLPDVKKKAYANALSRGVMLLLGLKGLHAEDLADLGFAVKGVEYAKNQSRTSKRETKAASTTIGVKDLAALKAGSVVNVACTLAGIDQGQTKTGKDRIVYDVSDGGSLTERVTYWGSTAPGWADEAIGAEVVLTNVTVKDQAGKRYYNCAGIELAGATE